MNRPDSLDRPFFAYGMFKPDEIAYPQIEPFVAEFADVAIPGIELERDGLRLLVAKTEEGAVLEKVEHARRGRIRGSLIAFKPGAANAAMDAISALEPDEFYWWDTREVHGETVNVLVGRSATKGSHPAGGPWRSRDDPAFAEAMDVAQPEPYKGEANGDHDLLDFYAYQMRYLLLWASIERFAALRCGFLKPVARVTRFAGSEKAFGDALRLVVDPSRDGEVVYRADDPTKSEKLELSDPVKAALYYYQVRSNVTHRGKSVHEEKSLIEQCLRELHDIFTLVLNETLGDRADGGGVPTVKG